MSAQARIIPFPTERRQAQRLVTLRELRELFGFSERWWRYRLAEGMPSRKWSGGLRFAPDEVQDWLDRRFQRGA